MNNKSIIDIIKSRKSIRTFSSDKISTDDYKLIKEYIAQNEKLSGPFGNTADLYVLSVTNNTTEKGEKIGTYGFIKNSQGYIAGVTQNVREKLLDYGYLFERLILFLTEKNIGTCWLGGTFTRDTFKNNIELKDNEIIPTVTPIGYQLQKQRFMESAIRFMAKSDARKPWEELFYREGFDVPLREEEAGAFKLALEMVRLCPSASNKQPWRIVLSEDKKSCHIYIAHTVGYAGNRSGFDMQLIDIGIAMCHLELSCEEAGIDGEWSIDKPDIELPNSNTEYIISWKAK